MQNQTTHSAAVRRRGCRPPTARRGARALACGSAAGEGTGCDAGRRLEPADGGLGLVDPAAQLQEAHRLGQPPPDDDGVQRRAARRARAPSASRRRRAGHDEVADQRRQHPADRPERLEQRRPPGRAPAPGRTR